MWAPPALSPPGLLLSVVEAWLLPHSLAGIYHFCFQKAELKVLYVCSMTHWVVLQLVQVEHTWTLNGLGYTPRSDSWQTDWNEGCLGQTRVSGKATKKSRRQSEEFGFKLWNKKKFFPTKWHQYNQIDLETASVKMVCSFLLRWGFSLTQICVMLSGYLDTTV